MWSLIYNTMCFIYPQTQWKSMNYGYATLKDDGVLIQNLKSEDEDERLCLQLYHYMATQQNKQQNLNGLNILEIGSGRGGGLEYISKYLNPLKCVGVDYSENQVAFCKNQYANNQKLEFFQGDSENLDQIQEFTHNNFDIVINVESSHCYGSFDNFVNQVCKLLKPQGIFCFTDFRTLNEAQNLQKYFENHNQLVIINIYTYILYNNKELVEYEDITVNVLQSLKLDEKRRTQLIENNVIFFLRPFFCKFSGLQGTRINQEFATRETIYVAYFLRRKNN
ncbi:methyltransferase, putative [Ichthyophthirius multifiliis]|uniref:Methyltransferase, putative n=1 Tax=Ichthyophthirius multifiliis TaxID=5932 RepID=G0QQW4_ICHMU|nr:methyltransferase, putative [Ichthyophthirius multifiliis]EGR32394.1 methyltransferase, putative [Ichthyophthirius multifiliis]|eukprot:XP_004035880.1 methyltransferase, putative [Ichthyophthirius multifiliis]